MVAGAGQMMACGKLPIPLCPCERCGRGLKFNRGWQWIDPVIVINDAGKGEDCGNGQCYRCPLSFRTIAGRVPDNASIMGHRVGMLWVGEQSYPTPSDWMRETMALGVSRRIPTVPRGFVAGETWIWVAHRKCIPGLDPELAAGAGLPIEYAPGVFHAFRSERIECVVDDDVSDDEVDDLLDRGITPVRVERRKNWSHIGILDDFTGRKDDDDEQEEDDSADDDSADDDSADDDA